MLHLIPSYYIQIHEPTGVYKIDYLNLQLPCFEVHALYHLFVHINLQNSQHSKFRTTVSFMYIGA